MWDNMEENASEQKIIITSLNFKENNFFAVNLNFSRVMESSAKLPSVYFKILFALCAYEQGQEVSIDNIKDFVEKDVKNTKKIFEILNFWRENGFINFRENLDSKQSENTAPALNEPIILVEDVCEILETEKPFRDFIRKGQNIIGKMFNPNELQIMYKLHSVYKIEKKLLLALIQMCKEDNHNSVAYFEKNAIDLCSNGVLTYAQYEKYYLEKMKAAEIEPKIKEIFSLGDKKFNSKERAAIKKWVIDFEYDLAIIKKAYEICIERLEKYHFNYIAAIISNWNRDGCRNISDIESIQEKYNYNSIKVESSSFDLDQFFEKAVQIGMKREK